MKTPLLLSLLLAAACASTSPIASSPPLENRMQADHLPTPFSAAQLHDGLPEGSRLSFRMEPAGGQPFLTVMTFSAPTSEQVSVENATLTLDGQPLAPSTTGVSMWKELQTHASFPSARASFTTELHPTPLGTLECWLYTVTADGNPASVSKFWFDPARPGPPVELLQTVDGAPVFRMLMVSDERS